MEKIMQFKNKVVSQNSSLALVDENEAVLYPKSRVQNKKMWRDQDATMAYLEYRDKPALFLSREMYFKNPDNTYSRFSICSEGFGNIPTCYTLSTYECSNLCPNPLNLSKRFIREDLWEASANYRCQSALYARDFDKRGRCSWVSVISQERKGLNTFFNAVDLKMQYEGNSSIPSKVSVLPPDKVFAYQKRPESGGKFFQKVPEATKELLKNFNITLPTEKELMRVQMQKRSTGR